MSQRYLGAGRFARAEEAFVKAKPPPAFWVLWNNVFNRPAHENMRRGKDTGGGNYWENATFFYWLNLF